MSSEKPFNRRRFFRDGLRELLRPLADVVQPLEEAARQFAELDRLESAVPSAQSPFSYPSEPANPLPGLECGLLRPPGALPEEQFTAMCSRCAACVAVCPAQCIKIDAEGQRGGGLPYIDPDEMPCVVCEGLLCMNNCPSGALQPLPREQIRMGLAVVDEALCLRGQGQQCTVCIEQCPLGPAAIGLVEDRVGVIAEGCIGCGVCQKYCPTTPKSITVVRAGG